MTETANKFRASAAAVVKLSDLLSQAVKGLEEEEGGLKPKPIKKEEAQPPPEVAEHKEVPQDSESPEQEVITPPPRS
jgi:hypothetical protein